MKISIFGVVCRTQSLGALIYSGYSHLPSVKRHPVAILSRHDMYNIYYTSSGLYTLRNDVNFL